MQLVDIDKATYRKNLNWVIIGFIACLSGFSLLFGQLLIAMFADGVNSNFKFNLAGVILGLLLTASILSSVKNHPKLTEVLYVWQLKQVINKIYRKLKAIKMAAKEDNVNAIIILNFYFHACEQQYTLDDNTITLSTLIQEKDNLAQRIEKLNLTVSVNDFKPDLLADF